MEFPNDNLPILAGVILNAGRAMANVMKYIYAVADDDFYNVNIKDVFRIALIDVTDSSKLDSLGIDTNKKEVRDMFSSPEFQRVQNMICYHLAARIPYLKKQIENLPLKDKQLKILFESVKAEGADNFGGMIYETYEENFKAAKSRNPVPAISSDWFRRYVYTYMSQFSEINNRNMFFLGCVEALFPLYYTGVVNEIKKVVFLLQK